jgi:hypothetical protein
MQMARWVELVSRPRSTCSTDCLSEPAGPLVASPGSAAPRAGDNDRARWHAAMVGRAPLLVAPSTRGDRRSSIGRHPGVRQIVLAGMCMLPWMGECWTVGKYYVQIGW